MLRITHSRKDDQSELRLEGRLTGPWVAEVRGACQRELARGLPLALDLSGLLFADATGVALLHELAGTVRIRASSRFVSELMRSEETR